MDETTPPSPDRRWQPFADALWSVLGDWRSRCDAYLQDGYGPELDDVVGPCELGILLEKAVPLRARGWLDPLAPELLRFTEWVCECPWPPGEDDQAEIDCFVGSCVLYGLSRSPEMAEAFLPYLGPRVAAGLANDVKLPSRDGLWPEDALPSPVTGTRYVPLALATRPLFVAV